MILPHVARQIAQPSLMPVGFALALAILATFATLTSERLWAAETTEQPAPQAVQR
ncbi:hypothetical protein [Nioella aestuarii]|uniref:hypothetical protein n=1 Tax=Nioella aestuarii TaxID=1662864 RepID=UPI003D7FFB65